ncbi:hypothetical protein B1757_06950 [Acidithiobacillus marinus]|uniref:Uncharacterized protein n=1 Tax=Acidithiobacillus marinus TaxID=187490 RepID=A0A2I1DM42_9PROT|nr:hypothetical protein B1757_06950 [Acidithiobacillus marinus]
MPDFRKSSADICILWILARKRNKGQINLRRIRQQVTAADMPGKDRGLLLRSRSGADDDSNMMTNHQMETCVIKR